MKISEMIIPIEISQQTVEFNAFIVLMQSRILNAFAAPPPRYGFPPMATLLPLYKTARDMGYPA